MQFRNGRPYDPDIDSHSESYGIAIRNGEHAYKEAFPWDKCGWGMNWVKEVMNFGDAVTVENLKEARKWSKDIKLHWGPGTFRCWLQNMDEKDHIKRLQEEAAQASQNPLAQEIAKSCEARDEKELAREYWATLSAEEKRKTMEYYTRKCENFSIPEYLVQLWTYRATHKEQ